MISISKKLSVCAVIALFVAPNVNAARCKLPKSYYKHVSCTASPNYFLAVTDSGRPVALLNKKGKQAVNLQRYQKVAVNKLSEGLLPVKRANKLGYVNMRGVEVIPATYDVMSGSNWARRVSNGRIVVKKNGRYGVINTSNSVILPFSSHISSLSDYKKGKAKMVRSGKTYWVNSAGKKTAIKPKAASQTSVTQKANANQSNPNDIEFLRVPQKPEDMQLKPHSSDGKWGFVDQNGTTMIIYSFDEVMPYSEDLAGVKLGSKWGFIDKGGNLIIPFRFEDSGITRNNVDEKNPQPAFTFVNGKAWIGNLVNGKKMCIDKSGVSTDCN